VRRDGEQVRARRVHAAEHERRADLALVSAAAPSASARTGGRARALEEALLEHRHRGHDARLAPGAERVERHVARDERGRELGVRGRAGAAAADVVRDVVDLCARASSACAGRAVGCGMGRARPGAHLLAVLVRDDRALGRARVGAEDDAVAEEAADDRRPRRRRLGQREALALEERVPASGIGTT
jgi:hypothetical protein